MTEKQKKILIVAPNWIGDVVMMHSLIRYLYQQHCTVHVMVRPHLGSLVQYMPEVSRIVICSICEAGKLNLLSRYRFAKKLFDEKYDQAIVLPNALKSALIPFFAKISVRTGWRGECRYILLNDFRRLDKKKYPQLVMRFLALGMQANRHQHQKIWPKFMVNRQEAVSCAKRFHLDAARSIIVFCPGAAYGESKKWPAEYYAKAALARYQHHDQIVLLGAKDARHAADVMMQSLNRRGVNLVEKTTLSDAVKILSLAECVVTNDSGLMHVAAALNRPLVAVYGSSSPDFTPPLSSRVIILVSRQLVCWPCFERTCPLQHMDCLKKITPEHVLEAMETLNENFSG
jgi:heptosyltransferase-2